jgi:tetratricopeptide (TPR) repeat protein
MSRAVVAALLMGSLGCATQKDAVAQLAVPEVLVETVPNGATVFKDGVELGTTPYKLKVPDPLAKLLLEFRRDDYLAQRLLVPSEDAAAGKIPRIVVPLRPGHWDPRGRPIPVDDAPLVARAGAEVSKLGRCPEALQFFNYALQLDPRTPAAHKGMGICFAKTNERAKAIRAYKQYLLFAPTAPDAEKIQKIVSDAEGDISVNH